MAPFWAAFQAAFFSRCRIFMRSACSCWATCHAASSAWKFAWRTESSAAFFTRFGRRGLRGSSGPSTRYFSLGYLTFQKVMIVGASVHLGWAAREPLALGASWGHHMTSRERKKTGGHLSKNTRSRFSSRGPHWPGHPRYGNATRPRFRSPTRVNLTLDMVVDHDRGLITSARLAGACVVARSRTITAFQRPPWGWA